MTKAAPATSRVRTTAKGGTSPFAHLTSIPPMHAEDPKDDKDKDKDARKRMEGESDDDYNARMAKLDEDEKNAADPDKDKDAENPDKDKDAAGDDKEKEAAAVARGASAERTRWVGVMSAPETAGRLATACTLLADTELSATQIVGVLKTTPIAKAGGLAARMAADDAVRAPAPDAGGKEKLAANDPKGIAAQIMAVADRARATSAKAA